MKQELNQEKAVLGNLLMVAPEVELPVQLQETQSDIGGHTSMKVATQRSQDTLSKIIVMMHWQVNRQFRKDREAVVARNLNPNTVI